MADGLDGLNDTVQAVELNINTQVSAIAGELGTLNDDVRDLRTSVESREIRKYTPGELQYPSD
jgi:hypothetical protein